MVMARESSVQFILQNALLIYQFVYQPLLELDFTSSLISILGQDVKISPSTRWIGGLILQIVSITLSAKSTFSPINDNATLSGFKNNNMMGLIHYIGQMFQVILHLVFAVGVVYLLKVNNYIGEICNSPEKYRSGRNSPGGTTLLTCRTSQFCYYSL